MCGAGEWAVARAPVPIFGHSLGLCASLFALSRDGERARPCLYYLYWFGCLYALARSDAVYRERERLKVCVGAYATIRTVYYTYVLRLRCNSLMLDYVSLSLYVV